MRRFVPDNRSPDAITDSGDSYRFEVFNSFGGFVVSLTGSAMSVAGISQMSCYICDPGDTFAIGRHTLNPTAGAAGGAVRRRS